MRPPPSRLPAGLTNGGGGGGGLPHPPTHSNHVSQQSGKTNGRTYEEDLDYVLEREINSGGGGRVACEIFAQIKIKFAKNLRRFEITTNLDNSFI